MKVLVTGREGQLAKSLLAVGASAGATVVAAGRSRLDLTHGDGIARLIATEIPDIVVNAAAYTAVDKAESEPEAAMALNAKAAGMLAEACDAARIPIIHISTDYVFDGSKADAYVEEDPTAPLNVYGESKRQGEILVAAACARHIVLRTSWVYSPYGKNFVKTMLQLAGTRREVSVVADQIGCPTFAPHLATAVLQIAAKLCSGDDRAIVWGMYHAAGTGEATWFDLAQEIFRTSGALGGPHAAVLPLATADYPTAARRPRNSRLNTNKLAAAFGAVLPDWRQGVNECVAQLLRDTETANSP